MQKNYYSGYLILITLVASIGGLLFGFDMAVVSGVLPFVKEQFSLSAVQEGWFVSAALLGCIVGVAFSGELSDRFGRKKLLYLSALFFMLSAFGCAFIPSLSGIIAARLIGGIGVGLASNVVPLYISEIAPAAIRGRLVTCYQLAITMGILAAYLSNAGLLHFALGHQEVVGAGWFHFLYVKEVWRGMFSIGALPALLFFLGLFLIPESPRWLILRGRRKEALTVLAKISENEQVAEADAVYIHQHQHGGTGTYKELLAPGMRKVLLIGLLLPFLSQFSGINAIIYYGPSILKDAGVSISNSFMNQVIFGVANLLFTLIAIWKVDSLGRRPLYLIGTIGAGVSLFLTGLCFYLGFTSNIWLLLAVLLFLGSFAFSIGPLKFVVAAEIFPNSIRGRAMALSIMVMWIADTIVGQLTPILLREAGAAYTFWFFAFFCLVGFIFVYKLLPETKGQSLEQIETFWREKKS